ncbi:MAG: SDR family NAD(P)-dependent oxidoreductase [Spirochaetota bacterium]|nr:SDR family NAD(P)-dependent oxidoreductase [Spirochaetota bacterium]
MVTGATGAIGGAVARQLAMLQNYTIVLVGRDAHKLQLTVNAIIKSTNNRNLRMAPVDLSRKSDIASFSKTWDAPLNILINNAATSPRHREETPEGIEIQWATNVLGYHWMTKYFSEHLIRSAPSRIINVASYWAGDLNLADPEFKSRKYDNNTAYRQSKQANRMLTVAQSKIFNPELVTVNACHPGDVNSKLSNDLGFGGHQSPDQGAETPVWLATDPVGQNKSGKYFSQKREESCQFAKLSTEISELYDLCDDY